MDRSRFLHLGLIALLAVACGGGEEDLLAASDLGPVYSGVAGSVFGVKDADPGSFVTLRGRVLYAGKRRAKQVDIPSTQPFCQSAHPKGLFSEDFLVGPEGGLEGCVVYIEKGATSGRKVKWPAPEGDVVLDQVGCQYVPHVAILRTGQPLVIKSSDDTLHNVKSLQTLNPGFNQAMSGPGTLSPKEFSREEVPKTITCDVHQWMSAHVAIVAHPLAVITGKDGSYEIAGVPPGTYVFTVWHEKLGELRRGDETQPFVVAAGEDQEVNFTYEGR